MDAGTAQPTALHAVRRTYVDHGSEAMSFGGYAKRLPAYHPEGYLEAFAQIYSDAADLIHAHDSRYPADVTAPGLPRIDDGIKALSFSSGAIASRQREKWMASDDWPT